jgi:hypothetical protein
MCPFGVTARAATRVLRRNLSCPVVFLFCIISSFRMACDANLPFLCHADLHLLSVAALPEQLLPPSSSLRANLRSQSPLSSRRWQELSHLRAPQAAGESHKPVSCAYTRARWLPK